MIESTTDARQHLDELARIALARQIGTLGWSEERVNQVRTKLTEPGAQDFLYAAIEHTIGLPGYFNAKRTMLDVGCGTGALVHSALERGHDAYGIDLDYDRLAIGRAKVAVYGYPSEWEQRTIRVDARTLPFESATFDLVVGHQFIEHVADVPATIRELMRVTKVGGLVVLYAPDYRAPYEAHYEIPWPIFPTQAMAECWVEAFEKPVEGLSIFNYVTLPQVAAIFSVLGCQIITATTDRPIDPSASSAFDTSSLKGLAESAHRVRMAWRAATLPVHFAAPTSLAIAVRKQ